MIAQCPNCSARFRVADEKVPDKGVKVRCTKCTTVFKVTRDGAGAAPRDEFAGAPTPPPPPAPPPPSASGGAQRRAQSFDIGEPTGPVPLPAAGTFGHLAAAVPASGAIGTTVSLTYGAASPQNSLDLDLSLGPPPAPPPPPARAAAPGHDPLGAIDAALDAAMASSSPAGDFDLLDSPPQPPPQAFVPPQFQQPPPAPVRTVRGPVPAPAPAPDQAALDPFANLSLGGGEADPFSDLGPPPAPPPPATRAPRPAPRPTAPPPPPPPPPPAPSFDAGAHDPFAIEAPPDGGGFELDTGAPPGAAPGYGEAPAPAPVASREATNPFDGLQSSVSGNDAASEPALDEPRGAAPSPPEPEPEPGPAASAPPPEPPPQESLPRRGGAAEFEFDAGEGSLPPTAQDGADVPVELARIQLSGRGPEKAAEVVDPVAEAARRKKNELFAALFNVGSAVVVGLATLISVALVRAPRPLTTADFGFPLVWLALGLDTGTGDRLLETENVSTGAYPTRSGTDAFVVRGLVHNLGNAPQGATTIVTELLCHGAIKGRAESVVGLSAGPEEIHSHDSRRNDDLQARLAAEAASVGLPAQGRRPFLAVFPVAAEEADGCNVRLTLQPGVPPALESAFRPGVLSALPEPAEPGPGAAAETSDAGTPSAEDAGVPAPTGAGSP